MTDDEYKNLRQKAFRMSIETNLPEGFCLIWITVKNAEKRMKQ